MLLFFVQIPTLTINYKIAKVGFSFNEDLDFTLNILD